MTVPPLPQTPPPGRSVLVVDDEPMIRKIVLMALAGTDFTASEAGDAAAAVAAVRAASPPFDVVLLDLTLPDGDGSAVIPVIRQLAPTTRILVVSGHGQTDPAEVGADGFLAKPFSRASLLSAVEQALGAAG